MLQKLAAYPRQNGLALALREMGRIERTLYTVRWYQEPPLRRRVTIGLNKGEARHALARAVCFHRRGLIHDRTIEDRQQRASGLNLVVAAITLWNTRALEQAIREHQAAGHALNEEHLQHVSPLAWEHIVLTGEYIWNVKSSAPERQKRGRKPRESAPTP
jgi:TnpA family transposase